jgi:type II secretory pathway component PulK
MRHNQHESRAHGVAIIMVIVVLAGLLALAAPFVFSMITHSRAARSDLHKLIAKEGADAAVARALARLHRTTLFDNTDPRRPKLSTVTRPDQLKVPMEFSNASDAFRKLDVNVKSGKGLLWSATVEDEQGKVNLNTAPPALLGNLIGSTLLSDRIQKGARILRVDDSSVFFTDEDGSTIDGTVCVGGDVLPYTQARGGTITLVDPTTQDLRQGDLVYDGRARKIADYKFRGGGTGFTPLRSVYEIKQALGSRPGDVLAAHEFARLERLVTVQSGLDSTLWGRNARPSQQTITGRTGGFTVEDGGGFNTGTVVRLVQNGNALAYSRVKSVANTARGGASITFEKDMNVTASGSGAGNELYVQPELKHPININTASFDVLVACFLGVRTDSPNGYISRKNAEDLALFVEKNRGNFTSRRSFEDLLKQAKFLSPEQRLAVQVNATEPNSPRLRLSTVPFCFHSFGSYTIEGSGVVNSEAGAQLARHTVRQLVTLPTPWPGRFLVEYQAGFQNLLDQGLGSRVITAPLTVAKNREMDASRYYSTGDVRLAVGESAPLGLPGEIMLHCDESDPENEYKVPLAFRMDGYDMDKREGFKFPPVANRTGAGRRRGSLASAPTSVEMWVKLKGGGQTVFYEQGLDEDRNRVTFSYEPDKGLVVRIFDAGLECQEFQGGRGSTFSHLKRKPIEYIYPVRLNALEWYHVAASWKTSHLNGQEIRLDAQPLPQEPAQFYPGVKLGSDVSLEEINTIDLEDADTAQFPKSGAIKIGEEIIEYQSRSGQSLTQLRRGARLSAVAEHKQGELVVPYGYTVDLAQDLPVGGATLVEEVKANNQARTRVQVIPKAPSKVDWVLDTATDKLPVEDATEFPPTGFLMVEGELIYYGAHDATNFKNLKRAQRSSGVTAPARNLHTGQGVRLASIQISDSSQYEKRGIVQIDDARDTTKVEWIEYDDIQIVDGRHYLMAQLWNPPGRHPYRTGDPETTVNPGAAVGFNGSFREKFGIGQGATHDKNAKVIPVVRMAGPHCGNQLSPYGDNGVSTISVIERGTTDGSLRYIKQAYINQYANWSMTGPNNSCPARFNSWGFDFFVGLDDFVARRYNSGEARFVKWPSGELPDCVNAPQYVAVDRLGGGKVNGFIDEVKLNTHASSGGRIAMTTTGAGIEANDEEILIEDYDAWPVNRSGVNAGLNWPANGGLVRIEDELLYYERAAPTTVDFYSDVFPALKEKPPEQNKADRRWQNPCSNERELHPNIHSRNVLRLTNVKRGLLGTQPVAHPVGAQALVFDGMPVSHLTGPLGDRDMSFSVANGAGFPSEGYALIGDQKQGNEVVSWIRGGGSNFSGVNNFRGRFGTGSQDHDKGTLVRCLPFRYWDRDARSYDGDGLAYIQCGYAASDAIWDKIEYRLATIEHQQQTGKIRPRFLVRFDGKPNWDTEPTNQEGGLYEFQDKNDIKIGSGIKADQIEMRVFWNFGAGCFYPSSEWKRTIGFEMMRATYRSPLIMRRLDEVERR